MANNWFQFKQFRIQQDACAMKVTTDACLFGAWFSNRLPLLTHDTNALDIGAGTGLLSLMLAQQHKLMHIDAIEIDAAAAAQANMNVAYSAFANQIDVYHADLFDFAPNQLYDFIICNPPFHQQQLKTTDKVKNIAHHDEGLTIEKLLPKAVSLLKTSGQLALLIPFYRQAAILELANLHDLYAQEICTVQQSNQHPFFRSMLLFSKKENTSTSHTAISICDELPNYSSAFTNLLQPYYLNF
jgi:tRNA1Val (adenine37-N6)-methyltransferase